MSANNGNGGYISLVGLLGVAFVVLKLCDVIDWSWWWVTCPFWGGLAIWIIVIVLGIAWAFLKLSFEFLNEKIAKK